MKMNFVGKTAIITGSGAGLGRQYALELAKRGCNIVVNDIGVRVDDKNWKDTANIVLKEIKDLGGKAVANHSNVIDGGKDIINKAISSFGTCDILINNAGILRDKSFHKMTEIEWKTVIDVHLNGTFSLCHNVWPIMQEQNYGRIINIGSAAGLYGNFGQANYSAAKMGILGLTNTLAKEGLKHNIHVNCVVPIADSNMTKTVIPSHLLDILSPSHVTPFVAYLCHESCKSTGEIYELGGGWYSTVRFQRSSGIFLGSKENPTTLEDIHDKFQKICDFSNNAVYPSQPSDTLRDIFDHYLRENGKLGLPTHSDKISSTDNNSCEPDLKIPSYRADTIFVKLDQLLVKDKVKASEILDRVKCSIQFHIKDDNSEYTKKWLVQMKSLDSLIVREVLPMDGKSDVLIRCSDSTFIDLIQSKLSPEYAYFKGLLELKGSPILVNKVRILIEYVSKLE